MGLIHGDPAHPLFSDSVFGDRSYIKAPGLTSDPDNSAPELGNVSGQRGARHTVSLRAGHVS